MNCKSRRSFIIATAMIVGAAICFEVIVPLGLSGSLNRPVLKKFPESERRIGIPRWRDNMHNMRQSILSGAHRPDVETLFGSPDYEDGGGGVWYSLSSVELDKSGLAGSGCFINIQYTDSGVEDVRIIDMSGMRHRPYQ